MVFLKKIHGKHDILICVSESTFLISKQNKKKQIIIKKIKRHKIKETKKNICGKSNGI